MQNNTPKAAYNVLKMFNSLSGQWVPVQGGDDDVSAVACVDLKKGRLAVILVNFRDRYALQRRAELRIDSLPRMWRGSLWRELRMDATHANVWHDAARAELEAAAAGTLKGSTFAWSGELPANSVVLIEITRP
jgi:hypothetical protein